MPAPARLIDLTRSLRRAGRVPTGVDRVEQAYLAHLIPDEVPVYGIVRTAFGYLLLDQAGVVAFHDKIAGTQDWARASLLSRLVGRRDVQVQRAESDLRRLALARCTPRRLQAMLTRHMPADFAYYNVGHSNLTDRVLNAVRRAEGRIHVLIHDVIPLEYPQYQRPQTVAPFRQKLMRVGKWADRVIYNSDDTRRRADALMQGWGRVPQGIVSHLGTITPLPDPAGMPAHLPPKVPYFITVGTIEPRKNHALLLDLWEQMGADAPPLLICGNRGWENEAVFARLDALKPDDPVQEIPGLPDAALACLVQNAAGALFPSHAEGFGLPPVEALALGTRVLCNDLGVLREILGSHAHYHPVSERDLWLKTVKAWEKDRPVAINGDAFQAQTWVNHFKTVLRSE